MTDYDDLIQRLEAFGAVFNRDNVALDAAAAIKELVAERDRLLLEADPELPTIAYMTGAHDWKVRSKKAEADLAAARAALLWAYEALPISCAVADVEEHNRHQAAIAAARAEGGE